MRTAVRPGTLRRGGPVVGGSTVRRSAARRWALVAAGTALLVLAATAGPAALARATAVLDGAGRPPSSAGQLLERAAASADVPHSGSATSTAALGLPDLPRLSAVARLLGGTTRARVWWGGPDRWRVDRLLATGQRATFASPRGVVTFDYEDEEVTVAGPDGGARLPRVADLLPPQAARGILAGPGGPTGSVADAAAGARLLGAREVAGRLTDGVAVVAPPSSTLASAQLWVDRASGLPLEVRLVDRAGVTALVTAFDAVDLERPDPDDLAPPGGGREWVAAYGDRLRVDEARPDLAAEADEAAPWRLPATLAGLPLATGEGAVAYGTGLTRLAVVPLRPRDGARAVDVAREAGGTELPLPDGASDRAAAVQLRAGGLTAALVRGGDRAHAYLVAGTVQPGVLQAAVDQLLLDPPPWRDA